MNKIIAVVVTYNRLEMLKKCIDALQKQTVDCDILVVNNNSTDATEDWCVSVCDGAKIQYFNTNANIGGAGGFNIGMRKAVEKGYSHVWIMDDDCIPNKDSLEKLMEAEALVGGSNSYGFLSSNVLWTDGNECKMNRQKYNTKLKVEESIAQQGIVAVTQATFVSLLFPRETILKYGLPIKEFFIWGDDIEYTRRIAVRNNIPSYKVEKSVVVHAMKDNNGSSIATDGDERLGRYNYAFRNENYLYRKEGIKGICFYVAKCMVNILRILIKSPDSKLKRCKIITNNLVKGICFNPDIEHI